MKTASTLGLALAALFLLPPSSSLLAQGDLTSPGGPAPTMKSHQEIWDKIGTLETQVTGLEPQASLLQSQNAQLQRELGLLAGLDGEFRLGRLDKRPRCHTFAGLRTGWSASRRLSV